MNLRPAFRLAGILTVIAFGTSAGLASADSIDDVLAKQSDETKARYQYRHPKETLDFFGVEPGMTVVEAMPGGGWYTQILAPYLGAEGHIIGTNYALGALRNFNGVTEEMIEEAKGWAGSWPDDVKEYGGASASAFRYGQMPEDAHGTADMVLFFRALHGLARMEGGKYLREAIKESYDVLKPGGMVGIVQHSVREDVPDGWATGESGYLKESFVIAQMEAAGFEFVGRSDINANANDLPDEGDIVWRLPPSLNGSDDDPELQAKMQAIGESNRMTLKFQKPAG